MLLKGDNLYLTNSQKGKTLVHITPILLLWNQILVYVVFQLSSE